MFGIKMKASDIICKKEEFLSTHETYTGKIFVFFHIYCNAHNEVLEDQIRKMIFSGLYKRCDAIFCFLTGEINFIQKNKDIIGKSGKKFIIADVGINDTSRERYTLLKIKNFIREGDKFLYIHTKGCTEYNEVYDKTPEFYPKYYWRTYMEYFLLANYKKCLTYLDEYDTIGVNYLVSNEWWWKCPAHYSGNFWWCTAKYFLTLSDEIDPGNYWAPESYVLSNNPNFMNLFESGFRSRNLSHFQTPYYFNEYVDVYKINDVDEPIAINNDPTSIFIGNQFEPQTITTTSKNVVFFHILCNEHTEEVVLNKITKIIFSGLYENCRNIFCFLVGTESDKIDHIKHIIENSGKKFIIADIGLNDASYERFTLLKIKNYINPDDKILYIHTKGITRYHTHLHSNINDWVNLMDYFLIYNHSICLNVLETFETVGINYHPHVTNNSPHYSGNYWWCTANYFLSLNDYIPDDYYAPEFYLFSRRPRYLCLFYSNVDQYNVRFPFINYV